MRKTSCKHRLYIPVILFGIIILTLLWGCSTKRISGSKYIYTGDRVYYDFSKKMLYGNVAHTDTLKRPVKMKESAEVQVEITDFNPLNYEIMVKDTAYDIFESVSGDFFKYFTLPGTFLDSLKIPKTGQVYKLNFNILRKTSCDLLDIQTGKLNDLKDDLITRIKSYKKYISYVENISSVYDYLKSSDVLNCADIDSTVIYNIIGPVADNIDEDIEFGNSLATVFKKDFVNIETVYFNALKEIKDSLNVIKQSGDTLMGNDCKTQFEKKRKVFVSTCWEIEKTIKEFEVTRNTDILPNFAKLMLMYERLQNLAKEEPDIVTKSYTISKDIQKISIYKLDQSSKSKQLYDDINILLMRGFRIDMSAGFFVSCLDDEKFSLFNKDSIYTSPYVKNGVSRDTLMQDKFSEISKNPGSKVSFGGMAYLQAHSQNASFFNWGGFVGIGALFNDQTRWTGSIGLSLILGRDPRCSINLGRVISQVDRLAQPYKTDFFYHKTFDNIPVTKVWQTGWMIGMSWKIGKK